MEPIRRNILKLSAVGAALGVTGLPASSQNRAVRVLPEAGQGGTVSPFDTRAELASWLAAGNTVRPGQEIAAEGVRYRGASGATLLPSLPGLLKMERDCYRMEQFGSFSENDDVSTVLHACLEAAFNDRAAHVQLTPGEYVLADRVIAIWPVIGGSVHRVTIDGSGCVLTLPPSNRAGGLRIQTKNNFQHLRIRDLELLSSAPIGTIVSPTNGTALEVRSDLRPGDQGWGTTQARQLILDGVRVASNIPGANGRWNEGVVIDGFWFPLLSNVEAVTRWSSGDRSPQYEVGAGIKILNTYSAELAHCYVMGGWSHGILFDEDAAMGYEDFQLTGCYAVDSKDALTIRMSSAEMREAGLKEPGGRVSGGHFNGHRFAINIENRRQFTIDGPLLYLTSDARQYDYPDAAFVRLHNCHDVLVKVQCPEGGHWVSHIDCTRGVHLDGNTSNVLITGCQFGANGVGVANSSSGAGNVVDGNHFGSSAAPGTSGPTVQVHDATGLLSGSDATRLLIPVLSFGGRAVDLSYASRDGGYIRTGRLVVGWFDIRLSFKGSSAGEASISMGLPPPAAGADFGLTVFCNAAGTNLPCKGRISASGHMELFTQATMDASAVRITQAELENDSQISGSFTYLAERGL